MCWNELCRNIIDGVLVPESVRFVKANPAHLGPLAHLQEVYWELSQADTVYPVAPLWYLAGVLDVPT